MKLRQAVRFSLAGAVLGLLPLQPLVAAIEVVDNLGRTVSVDALVQRVVSLAPHTTELLYSAGAGDRVVGAVSYSDFPEAAQRLPRVGSYDRIDLERVLALKPDLIVGWPSGNPDPALEFLQRHSIPVFMSEPLAFEDIADNILKLGQLAGTDAAARVAAEDFRQRLAQVEARYRGAPTVEVFYQVWQDPLMTISGDHIISKVMALCGGRNLFPVLPRLASSISLEAVLAADPEAIVMPSTNGEAWQALWLRWPQLRAVRDQRLIQVRPDHLARPTARVVDGAEELCQKLQAARRE